MKLRLAALPALALTTLWTLVFTGFPEPAAAKVITDVKPTVSAKGIKRTLLKKVGVLNVDKDYKDFFLAHPVDLAAAPNGDIFVYDEGLPAIFRFDKNLRFICKFGRGGFGPGEFYAGDKSGCKLYIPKDNSLLFCDGRNGKIIHFDFTGKMVEELPLNPQLRTFSFYPVMDEKGNIYSPSVSGNVVDKWNRNGELVSSYMEQSVHGEFLLYEPPLEFKWRGRPVRMLWDQPHPGNTWCDLFNDGQLLIYTANNAAIHLFKNNLPALDKFIWIDDELPHFIQEMEQTRTFNKDSGKDNFGGTYQTLYNNVIRKDNDDNASFYLQGVTGNNKMSVIYKLDLRGELREVYQLEETFNLHYKRNHRFYGINAGFIKIFQ